MSMSMNSIINVISPQQQSSSTKIHIMAFDGIVHVNSLFTLALFLGLAYNPINPHYTLVKDTKCSATKSIAEDFVKFHVYSFSCFLFSSIVALGLKQVIRNTISAPVPPLSQTGHEDMNEGYAKRFYGHINLKVLRGGMFGCAMGSVLGCVFLALALVNFVEIKLGKLGCGDLYTVAAIAPLVTLVPFGLVVYVFAVVHAFNR